MKLALIADFNGLGIVNSLRLSYHLVLAQYLKSDTQYREFYVERSSRGDFIMLDNGAAENALVSLKELTKALDLIRVDEVVLPDVMRDTEATLRATMDRNVLSLVPPKMRAIVPQGKDASQWLACANFFASNVEFVTMCIPKHAEQYEGGRGELLAAIERLGWHKTYNIHLLGIWGEPKTEVLALRTMAPWVRGIDTAAPFAYAQAGKAIQMSEGHVSHKWNETFDSSLAFANALQLLNWVCNDHSTIR